MNFRPLDYLRTVRASQLGPQEKAVLVFLLSYANESGIAWPAAQTIADAASLSRATVLRCVATLRAAGWIATERKSRTASTVYTLLDPGPKSQPETSQPATSIPATSQRDTVEVSAGDPRSLSLIPAKSQPETLSAHRSAHRPAQGTAAPQVAGRRPGVLAYEASYWISAYERGASKALGHPFTFPRAEYGADVTLGDIVGANCDDQPNSEAWLEATVEAFCAQAKSETDAGSWRKGYGPRALLEWVNERGVPKPRPKSTRETGPVEIPADAVQGEERQRNIDALLAIVERKGRLPLKVGGVA